MRFSRDYRELRFKNTIIPLPYDDQHKEIRPRTLIERTSDKERGRVLKEGDCFGFASAAGLMEFGDADATVATLVDEAEDVVGVRLWITEQEEPCGDL